MSKRAALPTAPWGKAILLFVVPFSIGVTEHTWHLSQQRHLDEAVSAALDHAVVGSETPEDAFRSELQARLGGDFDKARIDARVVESSQQDVIRVAVALPYEGLNPFRNSLELRASQPLRH